MDFGRMVSAIIRAARLDASLYGEVERDPSYGRDALAAVILAALVGSLGGFLGFLTHGQAAVGLAALVIRFAVMVITYFVWALLVQFVGTRLFRGEGTPGKVHRALGFAYAPQFLNILNVIPVLAVLSGIVAWLWSIAAGAVATRQALDQDSADATVTVIVAAIVAFVFEVVLGGALLGWVALAGL